MQISLTEDDPSKEMILLARFRNTTNRIVAIEIHVHRLGRELSIEILAGWISFTIVECHRVE